MSSGECCTGQCSQGRDCPHRQVITVPLIAIAAGLGFLAFAWFCDGLPKIFPM